MSILRTTVSAFVFLTIVSLVSAQTNSENNTSVNNKDKIDSLHKILVDVWLNYPDRAMEYGQEALRLSKESGDSTMISKSFRLIAGVHYYKGDYDHSLENNQKAFAIATALKDSTLINNGYNNIGLLYYHLGSYQLSLEYLLRSIEIKNQLGETYGLSTTLNNIGLVFERTQDYEKARTYFERALEVATELEEDDIILYSTNNIGITYMRQGSYDKALTQFRSGVKMGEEFENINWGAVSARGIGEVYMLTERNDSIEYFLEKSLKASQSVDDKNGMAEAYYLLSLNALNQGNAVMALDYLKKCDSWATQIHIRQQQLKNLKLYSAIYSELGQMRKEKEYLEKYIYLRDSLFQDVVTRNLNLIPLKIKEEQDRLQLSKQEARIQNQQTTNLFFISIILITIPFLIVLIVLLRKNHRKNEALQRNTEELIHTQKLLLTSEKMASLGVLAAGVGHEINNPLNFIKNGIEALSNKLENKKDKELNTYFNIINEGVERATNIVRSLSHFSRKGHNMDEPCNLHEIIENCLLILHNKIRNKARILTDFTKQKVDLRGNEGRLHQAMMNIISNAEQAIDEVGTISIKTRKKGSKLEVSIKDDGEGISEENLKRVSDPFFTTKAPGEGTGLGLFITYSIIEEHGGNIDVISNLSEGTEFIITLPLK